MHLRKERFPSKQKSKLAPKRDDLFEVIARIRDNVYEVAILDEFGGVLTTFNVKDLASYLDDENLSNLRPNPSQLGEDDMNLVHAL